MEDQGKRLLIAVAIAFAVMLLWSVFFPPGGGDDDEEAETTPGTAEVTDGKKDPAAPPAPGTTAPGTTAPGTAAPGTTAPGTTAPGTTAPGTTAPGTAAAGTVAPAAPRKSEEETPFDTPQFRAVFTSWGGGIKSWQLHGKKFEDRAADEKKQTDLVDAGGSDRVAMAIGFDAIENTASHQIPADAVWDEVTAERTDRKITYTWTDHKDLEVTKRFELFPEEYLVKLTVTAKKLSDGAVKQALRVTTFHRQDPETEKSGSLSQVSRSWRTACYRGGDDPDTNSFGYLKRAPRIYPGEVRWGGFTHSYFLHAIAVKDAGDDQSRCMVSAVEGAPEGTMRVDVVLGPAKTLETKGKVYERAFAAYLGPKYLDKLDEIDSTAGFETDFEHSIDLGWFSFIARPLLWLLILFQGWVVNWGIAIILLTVTVKLATLYWTTKSMRSMRAMAKLKPQMEEIQKKHKDDRQRQQQEIMALYKAHKVNPLSGCLPMLLQMPIWFALYKALNVAAELYQAPFIPGWIEDLTAPDPFYALPILLMVTMFVQARLTPTTGDSTQQKMMQYGLPLIFGVFGFFFPAGLTLYIFTNTVLSALHSIWMRQTDPDRHKAPVPATAAVPAAPASDKPAAAAPRAKGGNGKPAQRGGQGGKRKKDRRS